MTTIEEVDALLEALSDEEFNLVPRLYRLQDDQKTCDLLLLALGLRKLYPGAELLQVEISQIRDFRGPVAVSLTDADGNVLVSGHDLANTALEDWTVADLLEDLARRNDGEWIKAVSSEPDDHWGECDCAIYLDGMEPFAIDLDKAAALPVPLHPHRDKPDARQSWDEVLGRLRVGLMQSVPDASKLYITQTDRGWEVYGICDSTGAGLRFGEALEAEILPGGQMVGHAVARLAETGYLDTLPREGDTVVILMDPVR